MPCAIRGRQIEPVEDIPEYVRKGYPGAEKTDRELRKNLCGWGRCPECDCVRKCEYGKEAIRRGFFSAAPEPIEKRPEREAYFLRQIPVADAAQPGWRTIGQMADDLGVTYQRLYKWLRAANVRPTAKIMTYFAHHHQHTAYYDTESAVAQVIAYAAQTGNQEAVEALTGA